MTDHVPDERLANYSQGLLQEPQLGEVEEHLLICEVCRVRLTEYDNKWGLNG
jgi:anti-sigma factor ChrR (cupin superfamily)